MKKLRLLLTKECNRRCEGCCNKEWDLDALPIAHSFDCYSQIMITGGEPLIKVTPLLSLITRIRKETDVPIYVYTAKLDDPLVFNFILSACDGITLTLHEERDLDDFYVLCAKLQGYKYINMKSMRLNIFEGIVPYFIPPYWRVKRGIKWKKDCPLPDNEVFMKV